MPCAACGHTCPTDKICQDCGSDPMIPGDLLCVHCDARNDRHNDLEEEKEKSEHEK